MKIKIRKFKPRDAEECGMIATENEIKLFGKIQPSDVTWNFVKNMFPSKFLKSCRKKGRQTYVAESNGKIVGYTKFSKKEKRGHVTHLFADCDLRGKGIGSKLLEFVESKLKKMNLKKIGLNSAYFKPTIKFYEKMGYTKIRNSSVHGIRVIYMEKKL